MVDPTKAQPRVHVRANEHHDGKVDNKKKAEAPPKPPPAVVPDFDKVKTHSDKALKKQGAEDFSVDAGTKKKIEVWVGSAETVDDARKLFLDNKLTPAGKFHAVSAYNEKHSFGALVRDAKPAQQKQLIAEYANSMSTEDQNELMRTLARSGNGEAVALIIETVALRDPARAKDLLDRAVANKMPYGKLIEGAKDHGAAMQLITERYRRRELDGGQAPLSAKLRAELAIPNDAQATLKAYDGVSPPDTKIALPQDLDYIAATGDLPPNIEAFVADALKSKDPKMLAAAKEILELRSVALANQFAMQDPLTMTKDELALWIRLASKQQSQENAISGDYAHQSGLLKAASFFYHVKNGDGQELKVLEDVPKLGRADQELLARLLASEIKPSALAYVSKLEISAGNDDNAGFYNMLSVYDALSAPELSNGARISLLERSDTGGEYHDAVVFEARANPEFRRNLIDTMNDPNVTSATAKYAQKILGEAGINYKADIVPDTEVYRGITQALKADPVDKAMLATAFKAAGKLPAEEQRAFAAYAYGELARTKHSDLVDGIQPTTLRARIQAYGAMEKIEAAPNKYVAWVELTNLPTDPKERAAYADQVGAYAKDYPPVAEQGAKLLLAAPDDEAAWFIKKGFGQNGISNDYIGAELVARAHKKGQTNFEQIADQAKLYLGPSGEQLVARAIAEEALKNPGLAELALKNMDPEMAWRVRGEWVRLAAGDDGARLDKAIALYEGFVAGGKIPKEYRDEFRAGAGQLLKNPDIAKKLSAAGSAGAKGLEGAATAPPRARPEPTAGVRSGGAFEA